MGQYINKNNKWYFGSSDKSPMTNNGLESFNGKLKQEYTLRRLLGLKELAKALLTYVTNWTHDHIEGYTKDTPLAYIHHPTLHINDWKNIKDFLNQGKKMRIKRGTTFVIAKVPGGTYQEVPEFDRDSFTSLNDYKKKYDSYYNVTLPINGHYLDGECDCHYYFNNFYCKHMLAVAISVGLVQLPASLNDTKIKSNRNRGRPKKIGTALNKY